MNLKPPGRQKHPRRSLHRCSGSRCAAQLRAVAADPMWWLILGVCVLFQWSGSLKNSTMTYYCKWVVDNTFLGSAGAWGASQSLLTMMGALPMALASVLLVPLTDRFGKRKVCGWFLLLGAAGGVLAGLGQGRLVPVAIGVALKCFGSAPTCCLLLAMVTDVVDHVEGRSGIRHRRTYHVGVQLPVRGGRLGDECTVQRGAGAHRL